MKPNKKAKLLALLLSILGSGGTTVGSELPEPDKCTELLPDFVEQVMTSAFNPSWKTEYADCRKEANTRRLYGDSDKGYRQQMESDTDFRKRLVAGSSGNNDEDSQIGKVTKQEDYRTITPKAKDEAQIDTVKGFATIQPPD